MSGLDALAKFLMKYGSKAKELGGKALEEYGPKAKDFGGKILEGMPETIGTGLGVAGGEIAAHHVMDDHDDEDHKRREALLHALGI